MYRLTPSSTRLCQHLDELSVETIFSGRIFLATHLLCQSWGAVQCKTDQTFSGYLTDKPKETAS